MRTAGLALLLMLLVAAPACAQLEPGMSFDLQDEGASQGRVRALNCVGAGVACTKSGTTGTMTISGGAPGSGNFVAVSVDFGAAGSYLKQTTVTGQAWVAADSTILCAPTLFATADRADGEQDAVIEGLVSYVSNRVVSTGFTLWTRPQYGRAIGTYLVHCTGG